MDVLDKGFVRLVGSMGDDALICDAARVSYGKGTKSVSEDRSLIRYMMRNRHSSPFEHVVFRFHVKAPLFVFRQWHRHRTWSYSEISARYSEMKDEFYCPRPEDVRAQSRTNKQGSDGMIDLLDAGAFASNVEGICEDAHRDYLRAIKAGVGREQARMLLPVNLYSEMYATADLHNLFHFLSLRMDPHAQKEIRDYANAMFALIQPIVPVACEAFLDYRMGAITLSRLEVEAVRDGKALATDNKREQEEWAAKMARLGVGR